MSTKVRLHAKEGAAPGWPGFLAWLAATHPDVYNRVAVMSPNFVGAMTSNNNTGSAVLGLSGDATPAPTNVQQFIAVATQAAGAILPLVQQQKILKMQLQRAQQGLPPLDVGAYIDPNQGVQFGLNQGTQRTVLWLGGGLLAAVVLARVLGSR